MADSISSLSDLADRATLVNNQDTVDADEHNTTRTATQNAVNLLIDVVQEQDDNYAGTTEPTLKSEGKIFCDTTNDPAVMKYYKDGSANSEELVGTTLTQTLSNKTLTAPLFTAAGGKASLGLGRDLNLKIRNNSSNPNNQIDITFDYLTLYDTNGRGAVESQTSALTLDVAATKASTGDRATSENSGAEQASVWYYIYVYSDGEGTINGLLAQASTWATVVSNGDNPSGSDYVRRVGAIRNDSGSDFLYYFQSDDKCAIESTTEYNIGSTTSTSWSSTDISALVPAITTAIQGVTSNNTGSTISYVSGTNTVSTRNLNPGVAYHQNSGGGFRSYFYCFLSSPQTVYIAVDGSTGNFGLRSYNITL